MIPHPFLRAYMAGVAVPSVILLFPFAAFCIVRFVYNADFPVERVLMFPLALVPAIWGLWNMAYLALHHRFGRHYSLGLHGALVPLILVPIAVLVFHALDFQVPFGLPRVLLVAAPLMIILYYLFWKYVVAFLNETLGVA